MSSAISKERKRLRAIFGSMYHKHYHDQMPGSLGCFYCGDVAETVDHCPPLNWIESRTIESWKKDKIEFLLIKCCNDCNRILSNRALFTPILRVRYIKEKLELKYEKSSNLWTDDEIKEMSPMFQKTIKSKINNLKLLHDRIVSAQWRESQELINDIFS